MNSNQSTRAILLDLKKNSWGRQTLKPEWKRLMKEGRRKSPNTDGMEEVRPVGNVQPQGREESLGKSKEAQNTGGKHKILRKTCLAKRES